MMWWVFVVAGLATSGTAIQVNGASAAISAAAALAGSSGVSNATLASFMSAPTVNATYTAIQSVTSLNYLIIYYIFGMLWTTSFVNGCATMVVAGVVSAWYFGRVPTGTSTATSSHACSPTACCVGRRGALPPGAVRPPTFYEPEAAPTCAAMSRLIKYYLGTVALGSFFIAFLAFIRAALVYVYKRLRAGGQDSGWLRFLCCCVQCCLGCLQKFVELVTRNAYVYTAIKGTGFCGSSTAVFSMMVANAGTVAAVTVLSEVILFLGKVLIACASTWICFAVLGGVPAFQAGGATPLTSTWLVIVVNFFFAYFTASAFMLVFDLAIDTVLICYLVDRSENGGRPAHVDPSRFDELETAAMAEAREAALGMPMKAPPTPVVAAVAPEPAHAAAYAAAPAAAGAFSYTHPARTSSSEHAAPAGSAAAYI